MILLDASVLIRFLRFRDRHLGKQLAETDIAICGITRAEILHGARSDADRRRLTELLDQFGQLPIAEDLWDKVGLRLFEFRVRGWVFPFQDVVLATIALEHDMELWSYDGHFDLMASATSLRLYHWPIDHE